MKNKILYNKKEECCGCGLCATVCPTKTVQMQEDQEGFLYPTIIDASKCIGCQKCIDICILKTKAFNKTKIKRTFSGYLNNDKDLLKSASGGLATIISRRFISEGGIVYGVSYSDDYDRAVFIRTTTIEGLERLRTSKYIQAEKTDLYKNIALDIKEGKKVLFIGLPCEVAAVKSFIKYPENLYTCELVCHGPTSPKVHRDYCSLVSDQNLEIVDFSVRYKYKGWKPYYIYIKWSNGDHYYTQFNKSYYGTAFQYLKRPSCNVCKFKGEFLQADLTIGDYHYAREGIKEYNPLGVSVAFIHNDKGEWLLDVDKNQFTLMEIDRKSALMNEAINRAIPARRCRRDFSKTFSEKGLKAACLLPQVRIEEKLIEVKKSLLGILSIIKKKILKKGYKNS